jgi:tRNA U34 5-methylaminomethyl-2-thiouridine-forming methyltransferase MnmC
LNVVEQTIYTQNLMKPLQLIVTENGSHSLWSSKLQEAYHSTHGAIQEAKHIFIHHGLLHWLNEEAKSSVNILEVGLGTGLNALLTYLVSPPRHIQIAYTGLEPYPVPHKYVQSINYTAQLTPSTNYSITGKDLQVGFQRLHQNTKAASLRIADHFLLKKHQCTLQAFSAPPNTFDIVYFDAFSPHKQPTMWTKEILQKVYQMMRYRGIMVTYCAQGKLRRCLQQLGMHVETLPGPPGKKEMTRTRK